MENINKHSTDNNNSIGSRIREFFRQRERRKLLRRGKFKGKVKRQRKYSKQWFLQKFNNSILTRIVKFSNKIGLICTLIIKPLFFFYFGWVIPILNFLDYILDIISRPFLSVLKFIGRIFIAYYTILEFFFPFFYRPLKYCFDLIISFFKWIIFVYYRFKMRRTKIYLGMKRPFFRWRKVYMYFITPLIFCILAPFCFWLSLIYLQDVWIDTCIFLHYHTAIRSFSMVVVWGMASYPYWFIISERSNTLLYEYWFLYTAIFYSNWLIHAYNTDKFVWSYRPSRDQYDNSGRDFRNPWFDLLMVILHKLDLWQWYLPLLFAYYFNLTYWYYLYFIHTYVRPFMDRGFLGNFEAFIFFCEERANYEYFYSWYEFFSVYFIEFFIKCYDTFIIILEYLKSFF